MIAHKLARSLGRYFAKSEHPWACHRKILILIAPYFQLASCRMYDIYEYKYVILPNFYPGPKLNYK
jgi:hypothetical protein